QAGATAQLVAQQLGHAGIAVTERHYIDPQVLTTTRQRAALKVLEGGKSGNDIPANRSQPKSDAATGENQTEIAGG
ncbi:MAG: hypothetical protein V2A73_05045, partial [Pseudomonadota bacterium]